MGNRAVISFKDEYTNKEDSPSIYLHWNGGRDSVEAFLKAAKIIGIREDSSYCCARVAQMIGNWFGGILSVGVGTYSTLDADNFNNGVYWVENFEIIDREFFTGKEQQKHDHNNLVREILLANQKPFDLSDELISNFDKEVA